MITEPKMITEQDINFYKQNGYQLIKSPIFNEDEFSKLNNIFEEHLNDKGDKLSDEEPLTYAYYHAKYKMRSPKNSPTYIDKDKLEDEPEPVEYEEVSEEPEEKTKSEDGIYSCNICGFQYNPEEGDPALGIPPGTPFEDLPEDWKCPICNASKDDFTKV